MPLKNKMRNMINVAGCTFGEAVNMASANVAAISDLSDRGCAHFRKKLRSDSF